MSGPLVGVIMGSKSDYEHLAPACALLDELAVAYEARVVSAHRTPDWMFEYAEQAEGRGLEVIIAGAGGAAHLPGMVASKTVLPVIGVPVPATALLGLDALMSIVQMPKGTPVATMAVGKPGAANAARAEKELARVPTIIWVERNSQRSTTASCTPSGVARSRFRGIVTATRSPNLAWKISRTPSR